MRKLHSEKQSQHQNLQCKHSQHVVVCNGAYTYCIRHLDSCLACYRRRSDATWRTTYFWLDMCRMDDSNTQSCNMSANTLQPAVSAVLCMHSISYRPCSHTNGVTVVSLSIASHLQQDMISPM
jgi:hypothetical protein